MARGNRRADGRRPSARTAARPRVTRPDLCLAILIVAITAAVYSPVRHNGFVTYDDPAYITANPEVRAGLTAHGIGWALTTTHDGNWFPLTWISHMADVQAFGLQGGAHHLVNVMLHALSTLLLFLLLTYATGQRWPSLLVALLFGVHPLHVESVAWASERKDVLSGLFWMVTLFAYVHYARRPGWRRYLLVLIPFSLGLMAKPMIVTLPFVLLLIDVWPLGRLSQAEAWNLRILVEKVPLLALAVASSTVTFLVQRGGGAVAALQQIPVGQRLANAVVSYAVYAWSFLWPAKLAFFYPYPVAIPGWQVLAALCLIVGVSLLAWRHRTGAPYLAVGWCWFLGTLVPVIGLIQVGSQAHADRYMYVPLVGLAIATAWGLAAIVRQRPGIRYLVSGAAALCCALAAMLAIQQIEFWRDDRALFQHALDVTENNAVAHDGLGGVLRSEGRLDEAIAHFEESVRSNPRYAGSQDNLGVALLARGRPDEAAAHFKDAIRLDATLAQARAGLGLALVRTGRADEALVQLREAVTLEPRLADVHYDMARLLLAQGHVDEALREFSATVAIKPDFAEGHFNLANVLAQAGRTDAAIAEYREALRLKPDDVSARCNLGTALATTGRFDEAIAQFTEALRLQPDFGPARTNLEAARQAQARPGPASTPR